MFFRKSLPLLLLSFSAFYSYNSYTGGIAIIEQSISGFKTGYAGAVTALDEPSTIFFNPAGLSKVKGTQFILGGHMISPVTKYEDEASTIYGKPLVPLTNDSGGDVGETVFVPNFYASHQLSDRFTVGLGVFAPFGLGIDYKSSWVGRYHGTKNDMQTININPSLAYQVHDKLTFGVGFSAQYAQATLESAIDFGGLAASRGLKSLPQTQDGKVKIKGDDWGYGFNFGALYEPFEGTRLGLSYRSTVNSELTGRAKFTRSPIGEIIASRTGLFKNTDVNAGITFPEIAIIGFYQKLGSKWAIMSDLQYTHWRRLKELRVRFRNRLQPDDATPLEWHGTFRTATGVHYQPNDAWLLGLGAGFDKSPIPDRHRTPRIPDSDKAFINTGVSARLFESLFFDLAYSRLFYKKAGVHLISETKGNLIGHIKTKLNILSAGLRFKL